MTDGGRRRVAILPFVNSAVLVALVVSLPAIGLRWASDATFRPLIQIGVISYGAIYAGAVPYVVLGLPAFFHDLRSREPDARDMAMTGFIVNLASPLLMLPVGWLIGDIDGPGAVFQYFVLYWTFGSVFAALCGALFALFYRLLTRRSRPSNP